MIYPLVSNEPLLLTDVHAVLNTIKPIIADCLQRVRSWPVPRNWSTTDWFNEARSVATIAAWQAGLSYRLPAPLALFAAFVSHKIMSSARTRYRQEYLFGLRFPGTIAEHANSDDSAQTEQLELKSIEPGVEPIPSYGDLLNAIDQLSADHRIVVEQLFWFGKTETELAASLGLSQRGVNKRKQAALRILRELLLEEKNLKTRF